ncbi:MAG: hypothetical protein QM811_14765 [Pirellulales bacterium]
MKIPTAGIAEQKPITEPVKGGATAGQPFETIDALAGTTQLDRLNDTEAVVLIQEKDRPLVLKTVPLP